MTHTQLFRELGLDPAAYDDLHVIRFMHGFVAISHGHVIKITEPKLRYCPLVSILYGAPAEPPDPAAIRKMMEETTYEKMARFGHFSERREIVRDSVAVPYGTSEMLMYALRSGLFDAALCVCDGAGTVIVPQADVVQGVGARMNGLFYTTPIGAVVRRLEELGCRVPFPETAAIDQVNGLRAAVRLGYRRLAVTVNGYMGDSLRELREVEREAGVELTIAVVCTTGAARERVEEIRERADIVWSCASGSIRSVVGAAAIIQVSRAIPVFAVTPRGVRFLAAYSDDPALFAGLDPAKQYLMAGDQRGASLRMGTLKTYLSECALPARSAREPAPLTE